MGRSRMTKKMTCNAVKEMNSVSLFVMGVCQEWSVVKHRCDHKKMWLVSFLIIYNVAELDYRKTTGNGQAIKVSMRPDINERKIAPTRYDTTESSFFQSKFTLGVQLCSLSFSKPTSNKDSRFQNVYLVLHLIQEKKLIKQIDIKIYIKDGRKWGKMFSVHF